MFAGCLRTAEHDGKPQARGLNGGSPVLADGPAAPVIGGVVGTHGGRHWHSSQSSPGRVDLPRGPAPRAGASDQDIGTAIATRTASRMGRDPARLIRTGALPRCSHCGSRHEAQGKRGVAGRTVSQITEYLASPDGLGRRGQSIGHCCGRCSYAPAPFQQAQQLRAQSNPAGTIRGLAGIWTRHAAVSARKGRRSLPLGDQLGGNSPALKCAF